MTEQSQLPPTILIIFGAAGDLTWRKLMPALYNLYLDNLLPETFAILGVDGKSITADEWREHVHDGINKFSRRGKTKAADWKGFSTHLSECITGDFKKNETFTALAKALKAQDKKFDGETEYIFYLATPPSIVEAVVRQLDRAGLTKDAERSRVVFEKPFGHDRESAHALNVSLLETLDESQIYRIDHFLGKETVQNILAFRFANALFEPIWDRRYIDHIQITVAETLGVEHRGGYYEHAGAMRDMIQNHLMQIMSLIAMEPPIAFTADEIRARKVDVLLAMRPINVDELQRHAVRGQYGPGWLQGEQVPGYRSEADVDPESNTETFAALKLFIDNWRWQGIPFYLRTGKRLTENASHVIIQFRPVPHQSFPTSANIDWQPNRIQLDIQPNEGISLRFLAKQPGVDLRLSPKDMDFRYAEAFKTEPPEAYETLLLDVIQRDATLFMRADQVECAWHVVDPIMEIWDSVEAPDFPNYASGTWGPESAEMLIAQDGRSWL
jgi:glucose-6-phosphate 1-dehydrogenase